MANAALQNRVLKFDLAAEITAADFDAVGGGQPPCGDAIGRVSGVGPPWASTVNARSNTDDGLHSGGEFEDAAIRAA
jgi:hypothetical protein